jgi:hypothetical protein
MASEITFSDEEFSFKQEDVIYRVHTEVGNGFSRVVVSEMNAKEQMPLESTGDDE